MYDSSLISSPDNLADVFLRNAMLFGLDVTTKRDAIERMIRHLGCIHGFRERDEEMLFRSVLALEGAGTTGIGNGIAFPHCRSPVVDKIIGALALNPAGIPFDALDGKPVHSIFLIVMPIGIDKQREIAVLSKIVALGRDRGQCMRLHGCRTSDAASRFLREYDRA